MTAFVQAVRGMFQPGGALAKALPGFEAREPQIHVATAVAACLEEKRPGILQAGVGTGKTLGYALPACRFAVEQNKRIIISTNTKALQRQLLQQDLPFIQSVLAKEGQTLYYADARGQSNYLCKRKLYELYEAQPDNNIISRMIDEIEANPSMLGDRSSFSFDVPLEIWRQLEAEGTDCFSADNPYWSSCFAYKARISRNEAHIIVTNHAMFFSHWANVINGYTGSLPHFDAVIFDEAHRIDDVYVQFFTQELALETIERTFRPLQVRKQQWMQDIFKGNVLLKLLELRDAILNRAASFFKAISRQLEAMDVSSVILELPIVNDNPFADDYFELIDYLKKLPYVYGLTDEEKFHVYAFNKRFKKELDLIDAILSMDGEWATWIEQLDHETPARRVRFTRVPYEPKTVMRPLYQYATVILTSGTIAPGGDFTIPAQRLGLVDYRKIDVKSPFNYSKQALLVIPEDLDVTNGLDGSDSYFEERIRHLKAVLSITKGSTFFLFTSMEAIRQVTQRIEGWIAEQGLELFVQTPGSNRDRLLEQFVASSRGVLLGAESFWEGINVPGDNLRCVVIFNLPFPNPSDLIHKARMMKLEREGLNNFTRYTLQVAIIKMMQGVGRLIRTQSDRGAIVILDPRIRTKRYGDTILRCLPNAKRSKRIDDIRQYFEEDD